MRNTQLNRWPTSKSVVLRIGAIRRAALVHGPWDKYGVRLKTAQANRLDESWHGSSDLQEPCSTLCWQQRKGGFLSPDVLREQVSLRSHAGGLGSYRSPCAIWSTNSMLSMRATGFTQVIEGVSKLACSARFLSSGLVRLPLRKEVTTVSPFPALSWEAKLSRLRYLTSTNSFAHGIENSSRSWGLKGWDSQLIKICNPTRTRNEERTANFWDGGLCPQFSSESTEQLLVLDHEYHLPIPSLLWKHDFGTLSKL